jgi:hypothetical protein
MKSSVRLLTPTLTATGISPKVPLLLPCTTLLEECRLVAADDEDNILFFDLHLLIALSCAMISTEPFDEPQSILAISLRTINSYMDE